MKFASNPTSSLPRSLQSSRFWGPAAFTILLVSLLHCSDFTQPEPVPFRPGRVQFNTSPIPAHQFHRQPQVQKQVLYMPFGEAVARLESLRFTAESTFKFSGESRETIQGSEYLAVQDTLGNFKVQLKSPHDRIEVHQIKDTFFVRHGLGNVRHKPRRDIKSEQWGQLAFASMAQSLEPFRPRLQFSAPTEATFNGRETLRFKLSLANEAPPKAVAPGDLPSLTLPVDVPPRWREYSEPLSLSGQLLIDKATGVPLSSDFTGTLEITEEAGDLIELEITYSSGIGDVGRVRPIKAPEKSILEHARTKPPRKPLSFFKGHLPSQAEEPPAKN